MSREVLRRMPVVFALAATIALVPCAALAGEGGPLVEALKAADEAGVEFDALVEKAAPVIKASEKEAQTQALEYLKAEYLTAQMALEKKKEAKIARWISALTLGAKKAGNTELYGNARMVLWQELFNLAGSATQSKEDKVERAEHWAKVWEPLWEDLFKAVMHDHGVKEAEGNKTMMEQDELQMEIMGLAAKNALGRDDLLNQYKEFKEALEKYKNMSPEQRDLKQMAEKGFKLAEHRVENKEWHPAKSILLNNAIPKFTKLGDDRGLAKCYLLLAKVYEGLKEFGRIEEHAQKAKAYAEKAGNTGFVEECDNYLRRLRESGVDLTKSPFTDPDNFGEEKTIKLRMAPGKPRETRPLPQAFENQYFWRSIDLEKGVDEKGEKKSVKPLPFPGPSTFFVIWQDFSGRDVIIATDKNGAGARPLKYGKFSPKKARVTLMYWDAEKNKNIPLPYNFQIVENTKVSIAGNIRTFDPANSPNFIGLRMTADEHRTGKIDGQRFSIADDNSNAMFVDQGTQEKGDKVEDLMFFGCDSIVVGSGSRAYSTLYGSLFLCGDTYYFISEADKQGTYMKVKEYKGPMGKIALKFTSGRSTPLHFVLGTATGGGRLGFVNLGGAKGPVTVPTGSYFLKWGLLCRGSNPDRGDRVEIWPGTYPKVVVEEGKTTTVEFGGPYDIQMPVVVQGGVGELKTYEMKVFGAKGEEYRRFWDTPFCPDFKIKDANGRTVEAGGLRKFGPKEELEPTGIGIGLLEYAKHVLFDVKNPRFKEPFKAEFAGRHTLLGRYQTEGWR